VSGGDASWGNKALSFPQVVLTVENCGESPAIWFMVAATVFNRENQNEEAEFSEIDMADVWPKRWNAIGPKAKLTVPISTEKAMDLQKEAFEKRQTLTFNIAGVITYQTIFGEIYESEFWLLRRGLPGYHEVPVERFGNTARFVETKHQLQRPTCVLRSYRKTKDS
jgi:hypothetical protein